MTNEGSKARRRLRHKGERTKGLAKNFYIPDRNLKYLLYFDYIYSLTESHSLNYIRLHLIKNICDKFTCFVDKFSELISLTK